MQKGGTTMALLSLSDVSKSFGINLLFENISFQVENLHKIGLVVQTVAERQLSSKLFVGKKTMTKVKYINQTLLILDT